MATTIKKKGIGVQQFGGFTPYGNLTTLRAVLQTSATGAVPVSDAPGTALAAGTAVLLEVLPEGMLLEDAQTIVSDGMSAGVTGSLGFQYLDGVDDTNVPQDAAYFGAGLDLATATRLRSTAVNAPVKLPKPAYLVLTTAGADNTQVARLDFIVHGERLGVN